MLDRLWREIVPLLVPLVQRCLSDRRADRERDERDKAAARRKNVEDRRLARLKAKRGIPQMQHQRQMEQQPGQDPDYTPQDLYLDPAHSAALGAHNLPLREFRDESSPWSQVVGNRGAVSEQVSAGKGGRHQGGRAESSEMVEVEQDGTRSSSSSSSRHDRHSDIVFRHPPETPDSLRMSLSGGESRGRGRGSHRGHRGQSKRGGRGGGRVSQAPVDDFLGQVGEA